MSKPLLSAALVLTLALSATVQAQDPPQAGAIEAGAIAHEAQVLQPFVASYEVYSGGRRLGEATLQVVQQAAPRWRVDLVMHGTGLFKIAGINAEQSTVFNAAGETYQPLSQSTVRKTLFTHKKTVGVYDWASRSAQWQGDVKKTRARPLALQPGDMSGLLINLAVIRDAEFGKTLDYRFVDTGRIRPHRYVVAEEPESVSVGELSYSAMRVSRIHDLVGGGAGVVDNEGVAEETVIWVTRGVPTPIRMLQRENGQDTYDLRLVEYEGVQ